MYITESVFGVTSWKSECAELSALIWIRCHCLQWFYMEHSSSCCHFNRDTISEVQTSRYRLCVTEELSSVMQCIRPKHDHTRQTGLPSHTRCQLSCLIKMCHRHKNLTFRAPVALWSAVRPTLHPLFPSASTASRGERKNWWARSQWARPLPLQWPVISLWRHHTNRLPPLFCCQTNGLTMVPSGREGHVIIDAALHVYHPLPALPRLTVELHEW